MARYLTALAILPAALVLTGCVTDEKYNALRLQARTNEEQAKSALADAEAARREAAVLKDQLNKSNANEGNWPAVVSNLQEQLANLQAQNAELDKKYASAMSNMSTGGPLPGPLASELQGFASQNPDLVEFDAQKGMVKFKSDVTFAIGDATLTPKAKEAITRFSKILNSDAASGYELLVAGHTDNAPVRNPNTIAKGHKNNWYLSAHRAISVADALIDDKVSPTRLGVLGYADQRPAASNATKAGQAMNRRVEVMILPNQVQPTAPAPAAGGEMAPGSDMAPGTGDMPTPRGNNKDDGATGQPMPPAMPDQNK